MHNSIINLKHKISKKNYYKLSKNKNSKNCKKYKNIQIIKN
jgi:hypothetical protein